MKKLFFLVLVCLTGWAFSDNVLIHWEKSFGGSGVDTVRWVNLLKDGSLLLTGFSNSPELVIGRNRKVDYLSMQISATGAQMSSMNYGGSNEDRGYTTAQTKDGGFIIAGSASSSDGDKTQYLGLWDGWVLKVDASLQMEWQKTYGGKDNDSIRDIIQTTDGGYAFCGYTQSSELPEFHGGKDFWVVRLDEKGEKKWEKVLGGNQFDMAYSMVQTSDQGFVIVGYTFSRDGNLRLKASYGNGDWWILKLNRNGEVEWSEVYGGSGWDEPRKVLLTPDKGFIVTGVTGSKDNDVTDNKGKWDIWLLKLDRLGKKEWAKSFGGSQNDKAFSMTFDRRGNYFLAGYTSSNDGDVSQNHGGMDAWVLRISKTGTLMWENAFGTELNECAEGIVQLQDGTYLFVGGVFDGEPQVAGDDGRIYNSFWVVNFQQ